MAAQFDVARVLYQPQGAEPVQDLSRAFDQQASRLSQFAAQSFQQANASFDRAIATYNETAIENAQNDAPGIINRDGESVLIAPSSFYPSGLHSRAYSEAFRKSAKAIYRENAAADFQNFAQAQQTVHPTDPAAFKAALDERRTRMVAGLAEDEKGFIDLTLQGMTGKYTTQIGVNLKAAEHKVNLQEADRVHDELMDEGMRLVASSAGLKNLSGEAYVKAASEQLLSNSAFKERWEGLEAIWRRAGIAEPQIKRFRDELGFNASMKMHLDSIKGVTFQPDQQGRIDQRQIVAAQDQIRSFAKTFPGRSVQVEQTLMQGLAYAERRSSMIAQGVALDDQKLAEPKIREAYRKGYEATLAQGDPAKQQAITDEMRKSAIGALNDPKLSDAAAMRIGGAYAQAGGVALGALQESYINRLVGLSGIISSQDPSTTLQQRAQAQTEVLAIQQDPNITRYMTPGQRNMVQTLVDTSYRAGNANTVAGLAFESGEGRVTPQVYQHGLQQAVSAGLFGQPGSVGGSMGVVAELAAKQKAAYDKRIATDTGAREALEANSRGAPLTETQRSAIETAVPFRLPGTEKAPDWSNPGEAPAALPTQSFDVRQESHAQRGIDYIRQTGVVPKQIKEAMAAMPRTPDPQAMAPYLSFYQQTYLAMAERHHRLTGQKASDNDLKTMVAGEFGTGSATYLASLERWGADAAFKLDFGRANSTSISASLGQSEEAANKAMAQTPDTFLANMVKDARSSTFWWKLGDFRIPGTEGFRDTERERVAKGVVGVSPDVAPGAIGRLTGTGGPPLPQKLSFEPTAQSFISGIALADLAVNGEAIKRQVQNESPYDYAFRAAVEKYKDVLEIQTTADGTSGVLGFKTYAKTISERAGISKMDNGQVQASLSSLVQADRRVNNRTGADYDPASLRADPVLDGAQMSWIVTGREKTTNAPVTLMTLAHNDPRISAQAMSMQKVAIDNLERNLVGEDGNKLTRADVGRIGAAFAETVQAPLEQFLKDRYATSSFDKKAFVEEFDSRLRELNRIAGVTSAPDWSKAITAIANDPTPADGRFGSIQQLAREYQAAKGPEAAVVPKR